MSDSSLRLANDERLATHQSTRTIGGSSVLVQTQQVALAGIGSQPLPLQKYLKTSADSVEMAVDGSSTAVDFDIAPAAAEVFRIEKLVFVLSLASLPTLLEFGDIAALSTGLSMKILDGEEATILDLIDGENLKSNNDLAAVADLELLTFGASYTLRATVVPSSPIRLEYPDEGAERLRVTVADNLSTITRMRCFAQGKQEHSTT